MLCSCTLMATMSHLVTEDSSQHLLKVRTDIKNFPVWSSAWKMGTNEQIHTMSRLKETVPFNLVLFCSSKSQMNKLLGSGKPFFGVCVLVCVSVCTYRYQSTCTIVQNMPKTCIFSESVAL